MSGRRPQDIRVLEGRFVLERRRAGQQRVTEVDGAVEVEDVAS